jgi:hypothetical protein
MPRDLVVFDPVTEPHDLNRSPHPTVRAADPKLSATVTDPPACEREHTHRGRIDERRGRQVDDDEAAKRVERIAKLALDREVKVPFEAHNDVCSIERNFRVHTTFLPRSDVGGTGVSDA